MNFQVQVSKDDSAIVPLIKERSLPKQDQAVPYKITIPSLSTGSSITVVVDVILFRAIFPFPSEITQSENQLVKFIGNAYIFSPYSAKTQTTTFTLPNTNIESFSRITPTNSADKVLTYGPYPDVAAFTYAKVEIHYENNGPFLTVAELERVIEVSHWGNIALEEHIHIKHIGAFVGWHKCTIKINLCVYYLGAALKGPFSRYDFQRSSGPSAVKSYITLLPAAAQDVYYRDEIGNISTSNARVEEDFVSLELRPRLISRLECFFPPT